MIIARLDHVEAPFSSTRNIAAVATALQLGHHFLCLIWTQMGEDYCAALIVPVHRT
jgi:hypothetical protein